MTAVTSVKRESAAGGPRGEETRVRLLEAALKIFGELGFEGASTRALAEAAGANLAAIPYHFGSKEGLYRAAAEFIIERTGKEIFPTLSKIEAAVASRRLSREDAIALLHELLERFGAIVIGSEFADSFAAFVMREQLQPGAAFEILYQGMMRRMIESCTRLLAIAGDRRSDDSRTMIKAQTLLGQVLVFRTSRACVLRQLGWRAISKEQLKLIQSIIAENVDRILALR
ncbi:MAG TPA: CerR family C-terminal domain-containing protein [Candidatus Binataceae bacterium]|nr:CerR family C-terminal domain-containing protein [Candidatus Binataceae bacterium]